VFQKKGVSQGGGVGLNSNQVAVPIIILYIFLSFQLIILKVKKPIYRLQKWTNICAFCTLDPQGSLSMSTYVTPHCRSDRLTSHEDYLATEKLNQVDWKTIFKPPKGGCCRVPIRLEKKCKTTTVNTNKQQSKQHKQ